MKYDFLRKEMQFLGHVISSEGIKPDLEKINIVQNYPVPKNADETKRFIAFVNFYRKFIPDFAAISLPLNRLCRKNVNFEWSHECQKSFESLKDSLISPPILQYPNFDENNIFILQTDASGYAIGSLLSNSDNRPIAYASRSLNKAEIRYPTIEKELLAIVWSVKYFRPYLYGRKFVIRTDHKPLVYLFNQTNPSSRLTKFRLVLEEYDYTIEYVRGTDNAAADALSRIQISSDELKEINQHVVSVLTRGQKKRMCERSEKELNDNPTVAKQSANDWTDHPRVIELLKKPKDCTELRFVNMKEWNSLKDFKQSNTVLNYDASNGILRVNPSYRLQCARDAFVRELAHYCNLMKLDSLYIVQSNENIEIIRYLIQSINITPNWSGPRIYIYIKRCKSYK